MSSAIDNVKIYIQQRKKAIKDAIMVDLQVGDFRTVNLNYEYQKGYYTALKDIEALKNEQ